MGPRFGWPAIPHRSWRCSAAKAATYALPRALEKAGEALHLNILKDEEGAKIMKKMVKPRKPRKKEREEWAKKFGDTPMPILYHESLDMLHILFKYCRQDVLAEEAISTAIDDLSPMETELFLLDQEMNQRGFQLDMSAVHRALSVIETDTNRLNAELCDITGGSPSKATQRAKMQEWFEQRGLILPDTRKNTIEEALDDDGDFTEGEGDDHDDAVGTEPVEGLSGTADPDVRRALEILQTLALSSTAKFTAMDRWACPDGRVRGGLLYHGATTGRWSGAGVQPHNFPKGFLKEEKHPMTSIWRDLLTMTQDQVEAKYGCSILKLLSHALRGAITASPGRHLFVADYASIEVRVLLWLAEDEEHLDMLRNGVDMYVDLASKIYNEKVTKADSVKRNLGKAGILGCFDADTLVLTNHGWRRIVDVTTEDRVWDGQEWVSHEGCVDRGEKETICVDGVHLTPDHWIYVQSGLWARADRVAHDDAIKRQVLATASENLPWPIILSENADSQSALKSWKRVYDLANAGPRHRFLIWTDRGPWLAHNCGYQMGAAKFVDTAKMYGVTIDEDFSKSVVDTYRAEYWRVKSLWYDTEAAAVHAVENPGEPVSAGRVVYVVEDPRFLFCYLPSGRRLAYPEPEIQERQTPWGATKQALTYKGVDQYTRKWKRQMSYGGLLVENNTQATARDIMAEAMLRAAKSGIYDPILSVHDELICEAHPLLGNVHEFEQLLAQPPEWAVDCPIAAEGWNGPRYRK